MKRQRACFKSVTYKSSFEKLEERDEAQRHYESALLFDPYDDECLINFTNFLKEESIMEALSFLEKIDGQRQKWCRQLYGLDPMNADHYDLVVRLKKIPVSTAVNTICEVASSDALKATPESTQAMADLAMAADVRIALLDVKRNLGVTARDGAISVRTEASISKEPDLVDTLERMTKQVPGVKDVEVKVVFRENPL